FFLSKPNRRLKNLDLILAVYGGRRPSDGGPVCVYALALSFLSFLLLCFRI
ncbi:unnamed protein product, partial [Arabidopsis halleri]